MNGYIPATDGDLIDLPQRYYGIPLQLPIALFDIFQCRECQVQPSLSVIEGKRLSGEETIFAPGLFDNPVVREDIGEIEQVPLDVGENIVIDGHMAIESINGEDFLA